MPGVFKLQGKNGQSSSKWRFWFIDRTGRRIKATGTTSKTETQHLAETMQQRETDAREGRKPLC
jgi:hypothetical protein